MNVARIFAVLLLLTVPAVACYRSVPVEMDQLAPGMRVRARLTREEASQLARALGSERWQLDGKVVRTDGTSIVLEVPSASVQRGMTVSNLHQWVTVPAAAVLQLETKRLDQVRTGLLIGGSALAVAALVVSTFNTGRNNPVTN
ncbi:MAG TPA: hypothetical protein VJ957_00225, partial [Longimicrobiales bacterium]|nr:hypothetical protein [Longimicrobiales bacterium]